jgi:integrase/recombinase XerC
MIAEPGLDPDREDWEAARDAAVLTLLYGCGLGSPGAVAQTLRRPAGRPVGITGKGSKTRMVPVLPAVREAVDAIWRRSCSCWRPAHCSARWCSSF